MKLFPKAAVAALLTPSHLTPGMVPFAKLQQKSVKYPMPGLGPHHARQADHDLPVPVWNVGKDFPSLRFVNIELLDADELAAYRDYLARWQDIREMDPVPPAVKRPLSDSMTMPTAELNAKRIKERQGELAQQALEGKARRAAERQASQAERSALPAAPALAPRPDAVLPALPYALPDWLK